MPVIHDGVLKPRLASIGTALGAHRYTRDERIEGFRELWSGRDREFARVERFHRAVRVESRHLSLPMAAYPLQSFDEATRVFLEVGTDLAERAMGPGFSSELVLLRQAGGG